MPVMVSIGTEERPLDLVDQEWVRQQIKGRRKDGENPCVRVRIDEPGIQLRFATTSTCGGGVSGGGRVPNARESEIIERWRQLPLEKDDFSHGNIWAFLQQLRSLLS